MTDDDPQPVTSGGEAHKVAKLFEPTARERELDARLDEWEATNEPGDVLGPFDRRVWPRRLTESDLGYIYNHFLKQGRIQVIQPLGGADLTELQWDYHTFIGDNLRGANLQRAHLEGAALENADLRDAILYNAHLEHAYLLETNCERAKLSWAELQDANLTMANLKHADMIEANLQGAYLWKAHLEGAILIKAHLAGANFTETFLDATTDLRDAVISDDEHGTICLADAHLRDVNLAAIAWPAHMRLGDEENAEKLRKRPLDDPDDVGEPLPANATSEQRRKAERERHDAVLGAYRAAARAYQQVAAAMHSQGMSVEADHLAYRGHLMQRRVFRYQRKWLRVAVSWLLDLIAGYGYKPERSLIAYISVLFVFAAAYFAIGQTMGPAFSPLGAFVFSITSFHGRGFFPGGSSLDDQFTVVAAFEALAGLIFEVSVIVTFTRRFVGK